MFSRLDRFLFVLTALLAVAFFTTAIMGMLQ